MALKMSSVTGTINYLTGRSLHPGSRKEDQLLRERFSMLQNLHWKDLEGHYGCVNAIEFSNGLGQYIASGGDDRRVLLWDVEKALSDIGKPTAMRGEHNSNIFCVAFDIYNKSAFSGGNDEQVIVHDLTTGETKDVFSHDDAVYGLSADPTNPNMFASSCDDGKIRIFDIRDSCADPFVLANYTSSMHSVVYNPVEPRLLATANAKEGVGLWDVRKPKSCILRYGGGLVQQSCMSVRFNQCGDYIVALRRRLPPVLYHIDSNQPVCEFDHSGYYNSCTMKSICFAGDNDQYVLSGSDEFNLYMWALPDDLSERSYINSAHMVLKGHRSIVNQVRFNPANHLIISSGVEKIIKVWSPFKLPERRSKDLKSRDRRVYSHEEYINLVLQDGSVMSHDYSHESTDEDPRMMAFFDSLVQRELDGWSSDDSMSSNEEALYSRIVQLSQSDIDSDDSIPDLGQNDDDDPAYSPFTIAFASVMASQAAEGNDNFPRLNRALENAERLFADLDDNQSSEESISGSNDPSQGSENTDLQPNDGSASHKDLTALIKRKKQELRETMKRRMKNTKAEPLGSDSDENDNDIDDSSVSSLNIVIGEKGKRNEEEKVNPLANISEDNPNIEKSKQAQIKLQRLKNLRKRVLNSDSEASDIEIHEKKINSEVLDVTTSNSLKKDGEFEKVQFKKFRRRNTSTAVKNQAVEAESDDVLKSRASPDLGPFLQKAGSSASIEVRRTSGVEQKELRTGKFSGDSYSYKGKHKSKSRHRHVSSDDCEKLERSYSHKSKHSHTTDQYKTESEHHSSHHKHSRHYRERDKNSDHRDRKTSESERWKQTSSDKEHGDGRSRDSQRYKHRESENDHRDGRTGHTEKHTYHERKHHKEHNNNDLEKHDHDKCRSDNSNKHAKLSKEYDHDVKDYKHAKTSRNGDGRIDKPHRRRVKSDSYTALDFDEKRFNFYMERDDKCKNNNSEGVKRKNIDSEKKIEKHRKCGDWESYNTKHMSSDSDEECASFKSQKQNYIKSFTEVDNTDKIIKNIGRTDLCDSDDIGSAKDKTYTEKDKQVSSHCCNGCSKFQKDGDTVSCDTDSKEDRRDRTDCKCSFIGKNSVSESVVSRLSGKDSGKLESKTTTKEEGDNEKGKIDLENVQNNDDQEPSCSYRINDHETLTWTHHDTSTATGKYTGNNYKFENSDDGESRDSNDRNVKDSSSTEEDQLTWLEFKRFKNRLERARKRYTKEKHHRRNERRWSDEK